MPDAILLGPLQNPAQASADEVSTGYRDIVAIPMPLPLILQSGAGQHITKTALFDANGYRARNLLKSIRCNKLLTADITAFLPE